LRCSTLCSGSLQQGSVLARLSARGCRAGTPRNFLRVPYSTCSFWDGTHTVFAFLTFKNCSSPNWLLTTTSTSSGRSLGSPLTFLIS